MTLNQIWKKLRKYNKADYRQIRFCTGFAVMLISSYLMMFFSPIIQKTLPVGGDSRKQVNMIFVLAITGCTIFIIYAAKLFLRYKSREIGVFLSLGTNREEIIKTLTVENLKTAAGSSGAGILAGCMVSWVIGRIMEVIAGDATEFHFSFTGSGFALSIAYATFICIIMMIQTIRFLKRSNIMDIINEQRKIEPLKKIVTRKYLVTGIILMVAGALIAFLIPGIVTEATGHFMGGWTNLFYLLVLAGMYRCMVYSIACHSRGRNPQKYYNHLISYGMIKFTGASVVRNMLVITLLIMGSLFALFFTPMKSLSGKALLKQYESKFSYYYRTDADEITEEEVIKLAQDYKVEIKNYREAELIEVLASGVESDNLDENGNLIKIYRDKLAMYECIGQSEYREMTGQDITVEEGTYYMIQSPDKQEDIFNRFDDMDKLYLQDDTAFINLSYAGNVIYQSLVTDDGFDRSARVLVNDRDYEALREGAAKERIMKQVLFDMEDSNEAVSFSKALYREFALRQSESMKVYQYYDSYQHSLKGDDYGYNLPAVYDPDNSVRETEWQFEPILVLLEESNYYLNFSVFFMLFMYVAVICLTSVGIISFTRSQSVINDSRQVFEDIKRLGADNDYLRKLIKDQIKKIFVLPAAVGCAGMYLFELVILWGNDGRIKADEIWQIIIALIIVICVIAWQYAVYFFSKKKAIAILGL